MLELAASVPLSLLLFHSLPLPLLSPSLHFQQVLFVRQDVDGALLAGQQNRHLPAMFQPAYLDHLLSQVLFLVQHHLRDTTGLSLGLLPALRLLQVADHVFLDALGNVRVLFYLHGLLLHVACEAFPEALAGPDGVSAPPRDSLLGPDVQHILLGVHHL